MRISSKQGSTKSRHFFLELEIGDEDKEAKVGGAPDLGRKFRTRKKYEVSGYYSCCIMHNG